jgi:DNA modification methylase
MTYQILHGNNLDILPTLADNSIDSIVTDPPYELGFMGKKWDSSGIAYSVELWQQCLRVLKPGGHLLSFGGTRTYHRVAVAIEDAGFELRDSIAWLYGSGFPKSLDVSKAIDKNNGKIIGLSEFTLWMRTTGLTVKQVTEVLKKSNLISENGTMAGHYFAKSESAQPAIPTAAMWDKIRPLIAEVPNWVDEMVARVEAEREVIGQQRQGKLAVSPGQDNDRSQIDLDITAPSTLEAQQWQGWGTALKPAFEPVIVARKPIEGTVANNVLKWGTGGLNIDGSRIGYADEADGGDWDRFKGHQSSKTIRARLDGNEGADLADRVDNGKQSGRWPANIILDPYTAELLDEQSGTTVSKAGGRSTQKGTGTWASSTGVFASGQDRPRTGHTDSGGASRFFYVAKASKRDRNEGLDEILNTTAADMVDREPDSAGMNSPRAGAGRTSGAKNFHPTVKPTSLMEYLIKLVTPPQGTVLDPFTGSGSTGKAAILQGFDFIGIEMTEDYLPIIEGRLKHAEAKVAERIKETTDQESEKLF